jgi:hypothetical protein
LKPAELSEINFFEGLQLLPQFSFSEPNHFTTILVPEAEIGFHCGSKSKD